MKLSKRKWTKEETRLFHLYAAGLQERSYASSDQGIRECFSDLDVLQLDPLPILSRNHDLVIQARVDGTHPGQALDLIHKERLGFEYWDKVLCAVPVRHFPIMRAYMRSGGMSWERHREERLRKDHPGAIETVYKTVKKHGALSSKELAALEVGQEELRWWKATKVSNNALEVLWNLGKLSISHRVKYRRYFDLTERVIPEEYRNGSIPSQKKFWEYVLKKRVRNVGLLPLRGDLEAWSGLSEARTNGLPEKFVKKGDLSLIEVEGVRQPLLAPPDADELLEKAKSAAFDGKARFIAPLDPLLWCRRFVHQLWDFEYAWEVYKPKKQRRWGYYVLPVCYGDKFVARFDGKYDKETGTLYVLAYYEEPGGLPQTHEAIENAFERFLKYFGGERLKFRTAKTRRTRRKQKKSKGFSV
ncbi:YcaQ family DNA glycosylase [Candidatus Acetothermia bacterium]|nr:YcaQ family DNA glycosylase [Candidatus Acetothermia bacterium]